jgi:hypothetical protein
LKGEIVKKIIVIFVFVTFLFAAPGGSAEPAIDSGATQFTAEKTAQQHCPADIVVWLNLPTGIYHFQGQRWYGNTKRGAYVCKKEADKAGDRPTRNGQ